MMKLFTSIRWPWRDWPRDKQNQALRGEYETVFATAAGRRVLADIIRRAHMMPGGDTRPLLDPMALATAQGRRLMAMEIVNLAGFSGERLPEALAHDRLEEMSRDRRDAKPYRDDDTDRADTISVQLGDPIPEGD